MMRAGWGLCIAAILALSACDVVRVPGDGRAAPAPVPNGAPGPVPPSTPISDPYGDGEVTPTPVTDPDTETPTPLDTDEPSPPATDTTPPVVDPTPPEPEPLPIKFQYYAAGSLTPGSGTGSPDATVYAPDIIFPIKDAPTFPQSQVWRPGGGMSTGGQCDPLNYSAPWQDNFCETRSKTRNTPHCPTNKVHQGQDIRVGTAEGCRQMVAMRPEKPSLYELVAVEDGIVQYIGGYYIALKGTTSGNIYNYIHLNMSALQVGLGETVTAGQTLGYVSNDFGGTATTFHLHFEIKAPIEGEGITHVPPYMSLVAAYERREGGRGEMIEDNTISIASIPVIPDGFEIIE